MVCRGRYEQKLTCGVRVAYFFHLLTPTRNGHVSR